MNEKQQAIYNESVARSKAILAEREALMEIPGVVEIFELLEPRIFEYSWETMGALKRNKALDLMADLLERVAE